jgi:hypothetical protein
VAIACSYEFKGFRTRTGALALEEFYRWASAALRLSEHVEGIYIPSFVYKSFIFYFCLNKF